MITQKMILRVIPNIREDESIKRAKRYKILLWERDFSFHGFQFGYPLCCIMWYCYEEKTLRVKVPEYTITYFQNDRILCPKCLIKRLNQ